MKSIHSHTATVSNRRSLVWLLVLAVVLMSLSVTRQHVLGTLHWHADGGARGASAAAPLHTPGVTLSGLASLWYSRWQQQQMFGHGQVRVGMAAGPVEGRLDSAQPLSPGHYHHALERHHHTPGDQGVIALDGAAEAADSASPGAALCLPLFAAPSAGLTLVAPAAPNGSWPIRGAERFASLPVAPLLRPPAA